MINSNEFEKRLEQLDWTLYRVAKDFAEYRREGPDVYPPSRYHSTISRAIKTPETSQLKTIEYIVRVLNGELRIVWNPEQTITIRLDTETLDALQKRADKEKKTIDETAKSLLLQALAKVSSQQSLNLSPLDIHYRSWHPLIDFTYSSVHQWLQERPEANGYQEFDIELDDCSEPFNLRSISFQYYSQFPQYYFETAQVLDRVFASPRLSSSLSHQLRLCIVEVGSGMGVGTTTLVEQILMWQKETKTSENIEIISLGIDPNIYGITIYSKLMQELKENVLDVNINLIFQPICEPLPKGIITTIRYLKNKCKKWDNSHLSNLLLTQFSVASSLSEDEILKRQQAEQLKELGLEPDLILGTERDILQEQSIAYKQLLEEVPIENLYFMLLKTKVLESDLSSLNVEYDLQKISQSLKTTIGDNYRFLDIVSQNQKVNFNTPKDSYWYQKGKEQYISQFNVIAQTIINEKLEDDRDKLCSKENLELAWVRARNNLLNESLYDTVEIRLFEDNKEENLKEISKQLSNEIRKDHKKISVQIGKGKFGSRPKHLSRLEEEIKEIAFIQITEKDKTKDFDSYNLKEDIETEDLYEDYFPQYLEFLEKVKDAAKQYTEDGSIIRTDIKDYYKNIIQEKLIEISKKELNITSRRYQWLLSQLINKELDDHEKGKGLDQGTITSGFYANFYLKPIDDYFHNKSNVEYFRYVDDIFIVTFNKVDTESIKKDLEYQLTKLGLNINQDKTEIYDNPPDIEEITTILEKAIKDDQLETLNKDFNDVTHYLWRMNSDYRTKFHLADSQDINLWWNLINRYNQCLYAINIFIFSHDLSRKIYKQLVTQNYKYKSKIKFPPFPATDSYMTIKRWKKEFEQLNQTWINEKNKFRNKLIEFFSDSLKEIKNIEQKINNLDTSLQEYKNQKRQLNAKKRKNEKYIRFAVKKLLILGFDFDPKINHNPIVNLICSDDLYILRQLIPDVIISLAYQGHTEAIEQIYHYYENKEETTNKYIRAVILEALRFLPLLNSEHWEIIFQSSVKVTSDSQRDIERLKATETWLHLGQISRPFVKAKHIQNIVDALNSNPTPFARLKKNYILILGLFAKQELSKITLTREEKEDYLLKNALKIAQNSQVSRLMNASEPAIIKQYYNTKKTSSSGKKGVYSSTF
ncbi:MAG: reverse transcriptase domain-containing protein [Crocosphaera sp.]